MNEAEYWKRVALYLADVHAANTEGLPKYVGRAARQRLAKICDTAYNMIGGSWPNGCRDSNPADVERRLMNGMERLREKT